ncbi:MAG: phosphatase RsbU N-terminal domain-containing protein [Candidatus Omnitrophota bacterium]
MKAKNKAKRDLLLETNCQLQETSQKLYMAKQELEKRNKALEAARQRESQQKEQLEHELDALKHLARLPNEQAGSKLEKKVEPAPEKKLTKSIAEDLSLRYIHILESYVKTKNLDKDEPLFEELCQKLIEYGITPKGIIDMHLKSVPQIKTIGDLETKRVTFESRMVLLKVMTSYANLLMKKGE